jgi:TatD DNase family protein
LLETDAPDQPDVTHDKQRNEPAYLLDVWRSIGNLRDESAEEVAQVTTANAIELFRLPLAVDRQSRLLA